MTIWVGGFAFGQNIQNNPGSNHGNKFEQPGVILPTPNEYRNGQRRARPEIPGSAATTTLNASWTRPNLKLTGSEVSHISTIHRTR